jgi:hypothetical protein
VLWIDFGGMPEPRVTQLRPLAAGSVFKIYRIVKQ